MKNKRIIGILLAGLLSLPLVVQAQGTHARQWGVGIRTGVGQNDPKTMNEIYDEAFDMGFSKKEITKNPVVFGLEGLYEWSLNDEANKLGVRAGLDIYGQNELKLDGGYVKVTEDTYAFPISLYYKKDNGIKKWSWFAGAGVTLIHTEAEIKIVAVDSEKSSKSKVFPHIIAGGEYRFCKLFALGAEAKVNLGAKIKDDGDVISDRSGFSAAITGRFYF